MTALIHDGALQTRQTGKEKPIEKFKHTKQGSDQGIPSLSAN